MIKFGFKKEYSAWLWIYIAANIIAAFIMFQEGALIGDLEGEKLLNSTVLIEAIVIVVLCYFLILKVFFNFLVKLRITKVFPVKPEEPQSNKILGRIILGLQLLFVVFFLKEGVNVAGAGDAKSSSPLAFFWILMPIDTIFLVYYSFNRQDPLFKYNLIAYLLSNILRGWSGVFLFVLFFEWCHAFRRKKVTYSKVGIVGAIVLVLYPFLLNLKWVIRGLSNDSKNFASFVQLYLSSMNGSSYLEMFATGVGHLVGRLQHTSNIVEIIQMKAFLQQEFLKGNILPFWSDGLPQLAYRKILSVSAPPNVGVALTDYFFPFGDFELGSWNLNSGFAGWFFITPGLIPVYFLYIFFLCYLSVFLTKQLERKESSLDALWLAWLIYLVSGWIGAFIGFIYSIFIFILLRVLAQQLARIRFKSHNHND